MQVIKRVGLACIVGLFFTNIAAAQFGEDVRVSDTTGGFFGCIEPWIVWGPDSVLYVVWASDYTDWGHIYFSKSTDMGQTWSPSIRVDDAPSPGYCLYPCLAVDSSGNLYCTWTQLVAPPVEIRFSKSTDGGNTWTPSVVVDGASAEHCGTSEITVNGDELLVVWADNRAGWRCYFSKSTDGGTTWTPGIQISPDILSTDPRIEVFGDTIYAAYKGGSSSMDIYLSRSTDNGSTWAVMGIINDVSSGEQRYHDIALTPGGTLCCAWYDWRSGSCEIRFSKSTDGGTSWIPSVRVSDTTWSQDPVLGEIRMNLACANENLIYALWQDCRYGGSWAWDIFFAYSEDGGVNWSDNILVDDSAYGYTQMVPSLCLDVTGNPCVVWSDQRGPVNFHIYFDRGNIVGIKETVSHFSPENRLLLKIYPNPFSQFTEIKFQIENAGCNAEDISLKIYDMNGRLVRQWDYPTIKLSDHIVWDGTNGAGKKLSSGVYFCRFVAGDYQATEKLLLVR